MTRTLKDDVRDFWDVASCGEDLYLPSADKAGFDAHAEARYALEPYIESLARFDTTAGERVLEIGVGLGADHQRFAAAGAQLFGVDLTPRAVAHTERRLALYGMRSTLAVGDAENLAFEDAKFDVVYSWGVLHHSPDTQRAVSEVWRVLKPGGNARVMIYHTWSLVGLMLWLRYALLALRPWRSLEWVYARYLESPGTKAYSVAEARTLFRDFRTVRIQTLLSHGDLLTSAAGQRHKGRLLAMARAVWPRALIARFLPRAGLVMMIDATK